MKISRFYIVIIACAFLCCCDSMYGQFGVWGPNATDAKYKREIKKFEDSVFYDLLHADINYIANKYINKSTVKPEILDSFLSSIKIDKNHNFDDVCNFLIINDDKLQIKRVESDDYYFKINPISKLTYVHLFTFNLLDSKSVYLVSCVYSKINNEWGINYFNIGLYAYGGNAMDIYQLALKKYEKGNLAEAFLYTQLCGVLEDPGDQYFHYKFEETIYNFSNKLKTELSKQYTFPIGKLSYAHHVNIFSAKIKITLNGIYPEIGYKTDIDLDDSVKLLGEGKKIYNGIENTFPGMKEINKTMYLIATNEYPINGQKVKNKEFTVNGN